MKSDTLLRPLHEIDDRAYADLLDASCDGYLRDSQFCAVDMRTGKADTNESVESVDYTTFTYERFVHEFMHVNRPVMIRVRFSVLSWRCWRLLFRLHELRRTLPQTLKQIHFRDLAVHGSPGRTGGAAMGKMDELHGIL